MADRSALALMVGGILLLAAVPRLGFGFLTDFISAPRPRGHDVTAEIP